MNMQGLSLQFNWVMEHYYKHARTVFVIQLSIGALLWTCKDCLCNLTEYWSKVVWTCKDCLFNSTEYWSTLVWTWRTVFVIQQSIGALSWTCKDCLHKLTERQSTVVWTCKDCLHKSTECLCTVLWTCKDCLRDSTEYWSTMVWTFKNCLHKSTSNGAPWHKQLYMVYRLLATKIWCNEGRREFRVVAAIVNATKDKCGPSAILKRLCAEDKYTRILGINWQLSVIQHNILENQCTLYQESNHHHNRSVMWQANTW